MDKWTAISNICGKLAIAIFMISTFIRMNRMEEKIHNLKNNLDAARVSIVKLTEIVKDIEERSS